MGSAGASKACLNIVNSIYTVLGLGLAAASIWIFVEVNNFTSLRNTHHYLLDYRVYWPQALPWIFFVAGVMAACVSCCAFSGTKKSSRGVILLYIGFGVFVVLALLAAAVLALVMSDNKKYMDDFFEDTVWDAYNHAKDDNAVESAFGVIEKRLQCCGADGPRDYINWKREFPMSCCDVIHRWYESYPIECDFSNKLANERLGCFKVATQYARIAFKSLAAVAIFTAFIGAISLAVAASLSRALKKKTKVLTAKYESESKKVLI